MKGFFFRIIIPTLLAIACFVLSIFIFIIPAFESNMIESKKEMIDELTNSAWSILAEYEKESRQGLISEEEARKNALNQIRYLRYGEENKDYFWVTDMTPVMMMHPYRRDLDNKDISEYSDPNGKKLFVEAVELVKQNGEGYIEYMWQWKDDPGRIVPKLSYVKGFEPWGWIIGTGIYIEDVKEEIGNLTRRLIKISLAIILAISVLLFIIMHQSLNIENIRQKTENDLVESRERYRMLVEASTDGTLMVLNNRFLFASNAMCDMLGYNQEAFLSLDILSIFDSSDDSGDSGVTLFRQLTEKKDVPSEFEARLRKKDGTFLNVLLIHSDIELNGEHGHIIVAKDISSHKKIKEELGESREKFNTLINNINTGVFRTTLGRNSRFIEMNQAARRIFGFDDHEELETMSVFDLFLEPDERKKFVDELMEKGAVKNKYMMLKKKDGSESVSSVTAVLVRDENGNVKFCDGIVEDITEQKKGDERKEKLIGELQAALLFLNEPIKDYVRDIISCEMGMSIRDVASLMTKNKYGTIIVKADDEKYVGIVTDRDFKERVIAAGMDTDSPIYEIMTSPLISISEHALIYEAVLMMHEKGVKHLAVRSGDGKIHSVLSYEKLLDVQRHSSSFLIKEISKADNLEDVKKTYNRLPLLIKTMVDSGAKAKHITRIITGVSDAILDKIVERVEDEMGNAPAAFSFIAMGSEGRREQTLMTDQDNAIIYEDIGEERQGEVRQYFLEFGERVCNYLNDVGYAFCKGEIMAKNPKWCQPLSQWKLYFSEWINTADPQDLLEINIFFDFRHVFGLKSIADELRTHLVKEAEGRSVFFQNLAVNALHHKPPLGFMGKIVVKSSGENQDTFDIKRAIRPIVDFARIYSLQNGFEETNTLDRIHLLYEKNILKKHSFDDAVLAYNTLMQMRFKHQAALLTQKLKPDNNINPKDLTRLEKIMLKKTLEQVSDFQSRLSFDFTGMG